MTTTTWIWISAGVVLFLVLELIFIYIVFSKRNRFKQIIDSIDPHAKELNRNKSDMD